MNKTVILMVVIVVTALLIGLYIYSENTRYYIQSTGQGEAYKIDRKTGKTWLVVRDSEFLVEGSDLTTKFKSPEQRAIELVKNSDALRISFFGGTVDSQIKDWLEIKKGTLKIFGWEAKKFNNQKYLVSYTFDEGSGRVGFFFEVNLVAEIVREISGDPELEKEYGIKEDEKIKLPEEELPPPAEEAPAEEAPLLEEEE